MFIQHLTTYAASKFSEQYEIIAPSRPSRTNLKKTKLNIAEFKVLIQNKKCHVHANLLHRRSCVLKIFSVGTHKIKTGQSPQTTATHLRFFFQILCGKELCQMTVLPAVTTVFFDTRLWKTKHQRKRFQNFRQSFVLLTDRIEIHRLQPLVWPSNLLYVMLSGCGWWISIRSVNNAHDWRKLILETFPRVFCFPKSRINENGGNTSANCHLGELETNRLSVDKLWRHRQGGWKM